MLKMKNLKLKLDGKKFFKIKSSSVKIEKF